MCMVESEMAEYRRFHEECRSNRWRDADQGVIGSPVGLQGALNARPGTRMRSPGRVPQVN